MNLELTDNLSFCQADGQRVFLNRATDRYFRLGPRLDGAFGSIVAGEWCAIDAVTDLIEQGILREARSSARAIRPIDVTPTTRSVLESEHCYPTASPPPRLEVARTLLRTWCRLRLHSFAMNLERATKSIEATVNDPDLAAHWAASFSRARRIVPVSPRCLLDSLSLVDFLSTRGLGARLVIGVRGDPFAAHCWVQAGDLILNEAMDTAARFTPIHSIP